MAKWQSRDHATPADIIQNNTLADRASLLVPQYVKKADGKIRSVNRCPLVSCAAPKQPERIPMQLLVNGVPADYPDALSLADLLALLELSGKRLAVEVNGEVVPRSRHGERILQAGERVEIVHAIGGG